MFKGFTKKEEEASAEERNFGIKVEIDEMVFKKIMHWVNKSNFEVSGLGKVQYDKEENVLRVIDAILLPQKNTATSTDIEPEAVGKAMFQMRNTPGELRFWWHSHVDMAVFWSGTDLATIKKLGSGGWFLSTVFNKRQEMKSAFCQNAPVRLLVEDVPTEVVEYQNADLIKEWDEQYEKNVENERYEYVSNIRYTLNDEEEIEDYISRMKANKVPVAKKNFKSETGIDEETGQLSLPDIDRPSIEEASLYNRDELRALGFNEEEIEAIEHQDYEKSAEDEEIESEMSVNDQILAKYMRERNDD